jgi:glutamate formiminotransferase
VSLIECVPNVSEGRRPDLIARFAAELGAVEGVTLLDHSADANHNRSVFTFAGQPDGLAHAVLTLATSVVETIDLRHHRGVHPRLGALDVVPFIPLAGASMADCIALARRVGRSIADTLNVPVFLYEEAASNPQRKQLQDIRRGEFEGLGGKMALAEWAPDYGRPFPHPTAGATAVGARHPLIAFNVYLASSHLDIARRIASRVRESGGGLPYVKALGVPIADRGIVQVSMNLTRFETTSVQAAFDCVAAQARREGVDVLESELIGLIPRAALDGTTPERLGLRHFSADQILEERLGRAGVSI